jgi:hypothetical protein
MGGALGQLVKDSSGYYYILDSGQKLGIPADQLTNVGLTSGDFATISDAFLNKLVTHTFHSLARINRDDSVFALRDGKLYKIPSSTDLSMLGYSFKQVQNINTNTAQLFESTNIRLFAPQRLVRIGNNDTIYVIGANFTKQVVTSRAIFDSYGYKMSNVISVGTDQLTPYTTSGNLPMKP